MPTRTWSGIREILKAAIKAIECLDKQVGILSEIVLKKGGNLIITADHGNADDMIDFESDQPNTFHTKNPVPFLVASEKFKDKKLRDKGVLGNIAPTILDIMGIEKPKAMKEKFFIKLVMHLRNYKNLQKYKK